MYRRYAVQGTMGSAVMAATAKSLVQLTSAVTIRPYVYDFTIGTIGTPSDSVMTVSVVRASAAAATQGTAATPVALDSLDAASLLGTVLTALTAEQAAGVTLFSVGLNVRATYRWVAAPGGELVMAASVTTNGTTCLRALSPAYVLDANATTYSAE